MSARSIIFRRLTRRLASTIKPLERRSRLLPLIHSCHKYLRQFMRHDNFGDPVSSVDSFEDRWIIFRTSPLFWTAWSFVAPAYQCFAASKSSDPVSGGWNSIRSRYQTILTIIENLVYEPDGLYMSANLFTFGSGIGNSGAHAWAFNHGKMYAGAS